MKKTIFIFMFFLLAAASSNSGVATAGQGGKEIGALIRIFTPTPIEKKVEVRVENQGYDLKIKNKINTFTFPKGKVNVYTAVVNGNPGAVFLLYEGSEPLNILIYEPEDMKDFRSFLKKDQDDKKNYVINDFKKYLKIDLN